MTRDELLALIDRAEREGWEELDLAGNDLEELPPEIGRLTRLKRLILGKWNEKSLEFLGNDLSELPAEISQLVSLQFLDIQRNHLKDLPAEIGKLTSLRSLNLDSNDLSAIPREIGQLVNLRFLNLSNNFLLDNLPPEIGQLIKLQSFKLWNSNLNYLPTEFFQLAKLKYLDLICARLDTLPPEICKLTSLRSLNLTGNKLKSLPLEVFMLTNLQSLNLWVNEINVIPSQVEWLTRLQSFFLGSNCLSSLPPEIGQLTNLRSLSLSENDLVSLPSELGDLANLQALYLNNNHIISLPSRIRELSKLKRLDLRGNPIPIPSPILGPKELSRHPGSVSGILDFYFQTQDPDQQEYLYEAKLLIIGEGGAGKTSLAKKIEDESYDLNPDEETTEGIDVIRWDFPYQSDRTFRVNVWDFGGQEIYHQTHQFFLTERSLYALVVDERRESANFYYWLEVVKLLSGNSPVIIIKNEKQGRQCQVNDRQLQRDFPNIRAILRTNLKTNRGLDAIKAAIQQHISHLPHVGDPLPKYWVRIRSALENYAQHCNYISLEKYFDLCQQFGFTDKTNMLRASRYLHDLGICLHFQKDDLLKKTVILKPDWATTAVYKVCDTPKVRESKGRFTRDDLREIWQDSQYSEMQGELLQLMKQFKLCYEIPGLNNTFIAPHLLPLEQPEYDWDAADNLILRYEYEFMPKGMLTQFIVEMHKLIERQVLVWKTGVVLTDGSARVEVLEFYRPHKGEIRVTASGPNKKLLLERVRHELWKIHESYEELDYSELIPCNCSRCKGDSKPDSYSYELLQKYLHDGRYNIECRRSYEDVDVRRLMDKVIKLYPEYLELNEHSIINSLPASARRLDRARAKRISYLDHIETYSDRPKKEIFISYAWGGDGEAMADKIEAICQNCNLPLIRDKRDLGFKGLIQDFMRRIGRGKAVILIISEKYLKSENCMFELLEVSKNGSFLDRIFPIVLPDANIYKPIQRIRFVQHWEAQIKALEEAMQTVSPANMQGFRDDIDLYTEIRGAIAELTNTLKDMNTLTAEIHQDSNFEGLIEAIEKQL